MTLIRDCLNPASYYRLLLLISLEYQQFSAHPSLCNLLHHHCLHQELQSFIMQPDLFFQEINQKAKMNEFIEMRHFNYQNKTQHSSKCVSFI